MEHRFFWLSPLSESKHSSVTTKSGEGISKKKVLEQLSWSINWLEKLTIYALHQLQIFLLISSLFFIRNQFLPNCVELETNQEPKWKLSKLCNTWELRLIKSSNESLLNYVTLETDQELKESSDVNCPNIKKVSRLDKRDFLPILNECSCRGLTTWFLQITTTQIV